MYGFFRGYREAICTKKSSHMSRFRLLYMHLAVAVETGSCNKIPRHYRLTPQPLNVWLERAHVFDGSCKGPLAQ